MFTSSKNSGTLGGQVTHGKSLLVSILKDKFAGRAAPISWPEFPWFWALVSRVAAGAEFLLLSRKAPLL